MIFFIFLQMEDKIYCRVSLGHGLIFFSQRHPDGGRSRSSAAAEAEVAVPRYGASLRLLKRGLRRYPQDFSSSSSSSEQTMAQQQQQEKHNNSTHNHHQHTNNNLLLRLSTIISEKMAAEEEEGWEAFCIDTRAFIETLKEEGKKTYAYHNDDASPPPEDGNNNEKEEQLPKWPTVAGAAEMLNVYDDMRANLPSRRRCLRPPPIGEDEVERRMCTTWAPITDSDVMCWNQRSSISSSSSSLLFNRVDGIFLVLPAVLPPHYHYDHYDHYHHDDVNGSSSSSSRSKSREEQEAMVQSWWPALEVRSVPFMSSRIFNVFSPSS